MTDQLFVNRQRRAERRRWWDHRLGPMLDSHISGAAGSRAHDTIKALGVVAAFVIFVSAIGAVTAPMEAAQAGRSLGAWESIVQQSTWAAGTLACSWLAYFALWVAPPGRARWPQFFLAHAMGSAAFSAAHVLILNLLRTGIHSAWSVPYRRETLGFAYHYEKDLIAYVIIAAIFWLFAFRERVPAGGEGDGAARTTFDIEDGRRVTRVAVTEIAAVRAAGNYVEFLLINGRRPLMRGTLGDLHRSLGATRFVRVHRSWLVNSDLVQELKPGRWGDFVVTLAGDVAAPLSRRFPHALAQLRNDPSRRVA